MADKKEYRVWIEIEQYDPETDEFTSATDQTKLDMCGWSWLTEDIEEAERVALALHELAPDLA
jgi:hypothetical protein